VLQGFELVCRICITVTQCCRLFDPLTPPNTIIDAKFRKIPINPILNDDG
jgi:hypothetical protein